MEVMLPLDEELEQHEQVLFPLLFVKFKEHKDRKKAYLREKIKSLPPIRRTDLGVFRI
ncbi:hypothetical protein KC19_1G105000 [Ceratodon purpureus]|uniref:Uncharacterized protein n=1 Tax=Ceratodon purpureus TaxID=3225 RepID=A0A8T0J3K5_CERPU|nr:hypothetical protein KC19_1G105000 [Ceratodon purpureus]